MFIFIVFSLQPSSTRMSFVLKMPPISWTVPSHTVFVKPQSWQESAIILSVPHLCSLLDSDEVLQYKVWGLPSCLAMQGHSDILVSSWPVENKETGEVKPKGIESTSIKIHQEGSRHPLSSYSVISSYCTDVLLHICTYACIYMLLDGKDPMSYVYWNITSC